MGNMVIKSDYSKTYTTTLSKTVGTTFTSSQIYSTTAPWYDTSPTDAAGDTKIYVSPVAGAGGPTAGYVSTNPVNTLAAAFALLGTVGGPSVATRTTIHFIRYTYTSDTLGFVVASNLTLTATYRMQTEAGRVTQISFNGSAFTLSLAGSNYISNIQFLTGSTSAGGLRCTGSTVRFQNVIFNTPQGSTGIQASLKVNTGFGGNEYRYCAFSSPVGIWEDRTTGASSFYNCVFRYYSRFDQSIITGTSTLAGAIVYDSPNQAGTNTFSRCLFVSNDDTSYGTFQTRGVFCAHNYTNNLTLRQVRMNMTDCQFINTPYLIDLDDTTSSLSNWLDIDVTYSYAYKPGLALVVSHIEIWTELVTTVPSFMSLSETNTIEPLTPAMFVNYTLGKGMGQTISQLGNLDYLQYFRLQELGKTIPGTTSKHLLSSPLIGAGSSGVDLSPWDESTSYVSDNFATRIEFEYDPSTLLIELAPRNAQNQIDINGDNHYDYDSWRKVFTFDFQNYSGNETAWKLKQLMFDKGSKQFYPLGDGINTTLFTGSSTGVYSNTALTLTPSGLTIPMTPRHWMGFWVYIVGSTNGYFYISDNDATTFTLENPLSIGTNPGVVSFYIDHILVKPTLENITLNQSNFTRFLCGGAWAEKDTLDIEAFEYMGWKLSLNEIKYRLEY